jgi:hypothetical protein
LHLSTLPVTSNPSKPIGFITSLYGIPCILATRRHPDPAATRMHHSKLCD